MKIKITVDSICDLSPELIEKNDITLAPIIIVLGKEERRDTIDITPSDIYAFVDKTKVLPKTAAINETFYTEFFTEHLKKHDAVVHISNSGSMSLCNANAVKAAAGMKNVFVIDSKNISTGIGLQVLYAAKLRDEGATPQEIVQKVEARRSKISASFVVEKLDYIYKGGRCSGIQLFGANLLRIRPSIIVKQDGKMEMHKKYRGKMEGVVTKYAADVFAEFNTPHKDICFITYSTATPEMLRSAREAVRGIGFKTIYETKAGSTITCHCGKNTIGVLYYNDGE